MTEEDEAFNAIERQAKQRMEAVRVAMLREEDDDIQDYKKPWVGLTDEDRGEARDAVPFRQFDTATEYAYRVQIETEKMLKEKNT